MNYALLLASCVIFIELFLLLKPRRQATAILHRSRESVRVMAASDLSDDDKAAYLRQASADMLMATVAFLAKFLLIAAVLFAGYKAAVFANPSLEEALIGSLLSLEIVVMLTIAAACYAWLRNALLA